MKGSVKKGGHNTRQFIDMLKVDQYIDTEMFFLIKLLLLLNSIWDNSAVIDFSLT